MSGLSLDQIHSAWQAFLFGPAEYELLAIYRIAVGLIIAIQSFELIFMGWRFYSTEGWDGACVSNILRNVKRLNVFRIDNASAAWVRTVFIFRFVLALTFAAGFMSQLSALLLYVIGVSQLRTNPKVDHGGNSFPRQMLAFMVLTPCSEVYSLDQIFGFNLWIKDTWLDYSWGTRIMQLQVCALYFCAFSHKIKVPEWLSGEAVGISAITSNFQRRHLRAPPLLDYRIVSIFATYFTLVLQVVLPLTIWVEELRLPSLILMLALHGGIAVAQNLWYFTAHFVAGWVLFLPAQWLLTGVSAPPHDPSLAAEILISAWVLFCVNLMFVYGMPQTAFTKAMKKILLPRMVNYFRFLDNHWALFTANQTFQSAIRFEVQLANKDGMFVLRPKHFIEKRFMNNLFDEANLKSFGQYLEKTYPEHDIQIVADKWVGVKASGFWGRYPSGRELTFESRTVLWLKIHSESGVCFPAA
jgi:hypothetical protein